MHLQPARNPLGISDSQKSKKKWIFERNIFNQRRWRMYMNNWKLRFWLIFAGQAFSQIGSAITQFVLLWWITITTGEIGSLATAGIAALLPQALLGPLGGICADRYSRRLIMIVSDSITAICMVILIYLFSTDSIQIWHVYVLLFVRSSMQAFQGPASQASTAMLVPQSFLSRAAGFNQSIISLMTIAAAPIGALAISAFEIKGALYIDVFTAVLGILPLLLFSIPQEKRPVERDSHFTDFKEGVKIVWKNKGLRHIFYLEGLVTLVVMPSFTLVPLLITQHYNGTVNDVALIEGISGVGMLLGAAVIAYFNPKRKTRPFIFGFAMSCLMLSFTALTPSSLFYLGVFFWTVSGFAYTFGNAPLTAVIQTSVPNQLQGRVFALLGTVMGFSAPIGLSVIGPIGEYVGVRWVFVGCGLLAGFFVLLALYSKPISALDDKTADV